MLARGQSGVDMVFAIVFLLTVLAVFSSVQTRFMESHSLVTTQSQLHANARSVSFLLTQAGWYFPEPAAQAAYRPFAYFSSQEELFPPRSFGNVQSLTCTPSIQRSATTADANVILLLTSAQTGLPRDVSTKFPASIPLPFPAVVPQTNPASPSRIAWDSCDIPVRVVP